MASSSVDSSSSPRPSTTPPGLIERQGRFVEGRAFQRFITALIVINGITLGLETAPSVMAVAGDALHLFDKLVLAVFVYEILGKLLYRRLRFFRDGWNLFDFVIVGFALIPASGPLAVLRALRILRVLRLVSVLPQLRRVVQALLTAIPGMTGVVLIIALIFYVAALLATKLFGDSFPEWFGDIGLSMYTLFQLMTLESWSMGIVRPVMEMHPYSWAFFVPFIIITSFAILNLFIGIIVDSMQTAHAVEDAAEAAAEGPREDPVLAEVQALRKELAEMRREAAKPRGTGSEEPRFDG